jgi:hypothetical protein
MKFGGKKLKFGGKKLNFGGKKWNLAGKNWNLAGKNEIWREKIEIWLETLIPRMDILQSTDETWAEFSILKVVTRIACNYIAMKPMVLYQLDVFGFTLKLIVKVFSYFWMQYFQLRLSLINIIRFSFLFH